MQSILHKYLKQITNDFVVYHIVLMHAQIDHDYAPIIYSIYLISETQSESKIHNSSPYSDNILELEIYQ